MNDLVSEKYFGGSGQGVKKTHDVGDSGFTAKTSRKAEPISKATKARD